MKRILLLSLLTLSACTSTRSEYAEGVLVNIEEHIPKATQPCDVITALTLQTAQSGQVVIELRNMTAAQFIPYRGKQVKVNARLTHTYGCSQSSVTIEKQKETK